MRRRWAGKGPSPKQHSSGDSTYVHVLASPHGPLAALAASDLTGAIFAAQGRYGAFGAPSDVRVLSDTTKGDGARLLAVEFSALTPGGSRATSASPKHLFRTVASGCSSEKRPVSLLH